MCQLEWGVLGGGLESYFVSPSGAYDSLGPADRVQMACLLEKMDEHFVGAFSLAVSLRIVRTRFLVEDVVFVEEGSESAIHKMCALITGDL